jgi:hypothetical protein
MITYRSGHEESIHAVERAHPFLISGGALQENGEQLCSVLLVLIEGFLPQPFQKPGQQLGVLADLGGDLDSDLDLPHREERVRDRE